MSRENSHLDDSGEIVFNPKSYMGSPNLSNNENLLSSPCALYPEKMVVQCCSVESKGF